MKKLIPVLLCLLLLAGCAETYDGPTQAKSMCISVEQTYYAEGEAYQHYRTEYAYDIYGNQSRIIQYNEDEPTLKTILRYDSNGNVCRQTQYKVSGWLPKKTVDVRYSYDDRGRMTSTTHRRDLSWDNCTIVYDDEAGTRTTTTGTGAVTVEYLNELGWVEYDEQVLPDGQTLRSEYDRRPDGQVEAMRLYADGILQSETVMTYDDWGRILTQTEIADGVSTLLFSWEYGENHEKKTASDGSYTITDYNPDGSIDDCVRCNADGSLLERTIYRYMEIQVPIEEVSP